MITTANILVDGYALTVREAPVSRRASIIGQLIAEGCRQLKSAISFTHDMMAEALTAGGCATTRRQVGKAMKRLIGDGRLYAERQGNRWSYLWHETELPDGKGGDFSLELDGAAVVTVNEGRRRAGRPAKNPDGGDDNGRDAWSRRKTAAARERAASAETQPPAPAAEDATEAATAPGYAVADDAPTTEWRCPFHPDRKPRPSNTPGYFHCTQPVHFYNGKPTMYCSEQSHYHDADYAARRAGAGNRRPAAPGQEAGRPGPPALAVLGRAVPELERRPGDARVHQPGQSARRHPARTADRAQGPLHEPSPGRGANPLYRLR